MPARPPQPKPGEKLSAQWGKQLLDWIESHFPKGDGTTTRVSPDGQITAFVSEADAGESYFGQFKISYPAASGTANKIDIAAGKVINGLTVTTVAEELDLSITAQGYLAIAVWYNGGWKTEYQFSASYPTQGTISDGGDSYNCFRKVIASYNDDSGAYTWNQEHFGEVVNPRITG